MPEVAVHTDYKALYEESQLAVMQLRHELDQLKKMIFGAKQEPVINYLLNLPRRNKKTRSSPLT